MRLIFAFGYLLVSCAWPALAACDQSNNLQGPNASKTELKNVLIETNQGTWMSVDVARDGSFLVFDLLGDIYRLPLSGGNATLLADCDQAAEQFEPVSHSPAISPDSKTIAFISDRSGTENLWMMRTQGCELRQLTFDTAVHFNSPEWSEDGKSIIVRRSQNSRRGELWRYDSRTGEGVGLSTPVLQIKEGSIIDAQGPEVHGKHIYVSTPQEVRSTLWQALRPQDRETWQIVRLHSDDGRAIVVTNNPGGAVRPRISPDGRWMTYGSWSNGTSSLLLRDLKSNDERVLISGITRNLQDKFSQLDLLPGYAFSADSRSVFIGFGGGLYEVSVLNGITRQIEFTVTRSFEIGRTVAKPIKVPESESSPKILRWVSANCCPRFTVFETVGRLWGGIATGETLHVEPLTPVHLFATQPNVSNDGRTVFLSAEADGSRQVMLRTAIGDIQRLTHGPFSYTAPRFVPNAEYVLAIKQVAGKTTLVPYASDEKQMAASRQDQRELVQIRLSDRRETVLVSGSFSDAGAWPSHDRNIVMAMTIDGLVKINLKDGSRKVIVPREKADLIVPSPKQDRVAIAISNHVLVLPIDEAPGALVRLSTNPPPYSKYPGIFGHFPAWLDNETILWSVPQGLRFARHNAMGSSTHYPVDINIDPAVNSNALLLRGANLITMGEPFLIKDSDVLIRNGRFACIGVRGQCGSYANIQVKDVSGKFIIPGLIDVHQHVMLQMALSAVYSVPREFSLASTLLSYGVTTTRDPALYNNVRDFSFIEAINANRMLGPRYFATGEIVTPEAIRIDSLNDARMIVAHLVAMGATSIKEYTLVDRRQEKWLRQATAEHGVRATFEGSGQFRRALIALLDGYDGLEHAPGHHDYYGDLTQLMSKMSFVVTPTIMTHGADRFFREYDLFAERRLLHFVGKERVKSIVEQPQRGQGIPLEETSYPPLALGAAKAQVSGVKVAVGAHDGMAPTGLGTHWEIWSFVEGGMSAANALRAATLVGAQVIGIDDSVGSIENGKLADLLILDDDPLVDIRNTLSLKSVMKNGYLYDSLTLELIH